MTERVRVHFEQLTAKPPHMRLTQPVFDEAAARHPQLAARVAPSFGDDGAGLAAGGTGFDASVLVTQVGPKVADMSAMPALKWVFTTSAGVESFLPLDWLPDGACFSNNSGTHGPKTREYAAMALMMLHMEMPHLATTQREKRWSRVFAPIIAGKSVAIVGFGALGEATAEAARAMGMTVRAVKRHPAPHPLADAMYGTDGMAEALTGADFLVIAAPLTDDTRGLIGAAELDLLAEGAGVLNIGRGPILVTGALTERLDSGRLSGAVLDVFDEEPLPPASPLWHQKNLFITPHMSSDDPSIYVQRSLDIFFRDLGLFLDGHPPKNRIDPKLGY